MREVKAIKINVADFAPYGTFCNMTEPEGYPLQGEIHKFYPDRISGTSMGSIAFSPIAVRKDERIIKAAEYHTTTWEGIVALDDDMIIHVAPASGGVPVNLPKHLSYRRDAWSRLMQQSGISVHFR